MGARVTTRGWFAWPAGRTDNAGKPPSNQRGYEGPLRSFVFAGSSGVCRESKPQYLLQGIRNEIERSGVILFSDRLHLPAEFMLVLQRLPGNENIHLIVFCRQISELHCCYSPPKNAAERAGASFAYCKGFPIMAPVPDDKIDLADAYSFGESEVREFLGAEHYASAGHVLVLALPPVGQGMEFYADTLPTLVALLQ